ncbi:phospholipase B1, membrane-associated [Scaptodrosophila lebanonensis]|uniref:Phospholipase B1, membrane-associated n=1 Tax=Drosophila lebanonensis TaxID=7225 RepID=A0A6J2U167_DROLE|nr:phospholipase B1, membrane-associated [Scaptodrosophila lebanonensis]
MFKSCYYIVLLSLLLWSVEPPAEAAHRRVRRQNRSHQLLASIGVQLQRYDPRRAINGGLQYTDFDRELRQLFLGTRRLTLGLAQQNINSLSTRNNREGKMQARISREVPFPCPLNNSRSSKPPISVHRLRPGDIDIIAAFGDSLSAGNGIMSNTALDMINEFRGMTFSGGGLGNWRQFLTLPNILKVYNPNLYGYAVDNSLVVNHNMARLNIAEPMIMSHDLPFQARVFIDLLRRDPHVDMDRHWKLLTVFVGNNDLCSDLCHWDDVNVMLDRHARDLHRAFTLLRDNVPRLLINLVVVPNLIKPIQTMSPLPLQCFVVHRIACACLASDRLSEAKRQQLSKLIQRWQQIELDVAALPEFQREDFAIIAHPMIANITLPRTLDGQTDFRYFGHDCFHFSQRGHAVLANMLWNSMLSPDDQKPRKFRKPFQKFFCPSEEQPYFLIPSSAKR